MISARLTDALVTIVLLLSLGHGWRYGLLRTLASIIRLIAGATTAFFTVPRHPRNA